MLTLSHPLKLQNKKERQQAQDQTVLTEKGLSKKT